MGFALPLNIPTINSDEIVPTTDWYFLADDIYPWGDIKVYPAKKNGLNKTYPHQRCNGFGENSKPWRNGNICVNNGTYILGRGYDVEPREAYKRLAWNVKRTREWLIEACNGTLVKAGDPFEIPHYPIIEKSPRIVFCEDESTFRVWNSKTDIDSGLVTLFNTNSIKDSSFIDCFSSMKGEEILRQNGGLQLRGKNPLRYSVLG